MLREVPVVRDLIKRCLRCGLCKIVCPVFQEIRREDESPRGRVFYVEMLRNGELEPNNKTIHEKMFNCLLCESCRQICPSAIPVAEMITAARAETARYNSSRTKRWVFQNLWANPKKLRLTVASLRYGQKLGMVSLGRALGLTRLLPGDLPKAERILGKIPDRAAREQLPPVSPAVGARKYRVAYFLGCATDLLYPRVAVATVGVLTRMGCEVVIPRDIKCCGLPSLANGEAETAKQLAAQNAAVLQALDVDAVISDCASCTSTLRGPLYRDLFNGEWDQNIADVQVFIERAIGNIAPPHSPGKWRVTYHDACHLARAQGITQEPRRLLKQIPGVELVEMTGADACCGGSGTFALTHYDLAMKILERKLANINQTGAQVVAAACPSCLTQISYGINQKGWPIKVMHPMELLYQAYQGLDNN
ncbi:MAG: (Fe-S)-binding protein [Firmicutes bacterium]|nr:(Fe-S)-binding protein [Bacillota bacterium]